jgi:multidrug resistance efflux pump
MSPMRPPVLVAARAAGYLPWAALLLAACSPRSAPPPQAPHAAYAAVAIGRVDVEGGLLQLTSPREGTVASVVAREGTEVRRGDALVVLDDGEARLAVQGAAAELKQEQVKHQLLKSQLAAARQRAERLAEAARAGAGEVQAADDAMAAADELSGQMQITLAGIEALRYKLEALQQELALRTIRAPLDAQVIRVRAQPGAHVAPQSEPLITLLPHGPAIIRADLSDSYLDAVHVGMPATVGTEDDRGTRWRAHLLRISAVEGTLVTDEQPPSHMTARTVECVLALDGPTALRFGQRVLVRFGDAGTVGSH